MRIGPFLLCSCLLMPVAWSDEASKAAKIAELLQLTGQRQFLHEVDGTFDPEEALRAWARYYAENITESDLDAILAYYRSPAGQKDASASRAALAQVQRYMHEKHAAVTAANNTPAAAPGYSPASASPAVPRTRDVVPTSAPRAPDGRVVPSASSPERCEATPTVAPGAHPTGRSVVCVCIDEKGVLTRDPVIAESSGDRRVDSGALKMAHVDSGRYIPPTVNGQPQSACFRFAIDFSHPE